MTTNKPAAELADIFRTYANVFMSSHALTSQQVKAFQDISLCRTSAFVGHQPWEGTLTVVIAVATGGNLTIPDGTGTVQSVRQQKITPTGSPNQTIGLSGSKTGRFIFGTKITVQRVATGALALMGQNLSGGLCSMFCRVGFTKSGILVLWLCVTAKTSWRNAMTC